MKKTIVEEVIEVSATEDAVVKESENIEVVKEVEELTTLPLPAMKVKRYTAPIHSSGDLEPELEKRPEASPVKRIKSKKVQKIKSKFMTTKKKPIAGIIRKGDKVEVRSGKNKGLKGVVKKVLPATSHKRLVKRK